ncbi:hypothetical protein Sipo8835_05325 [Streptomyces ipomoeae]|uniref:Uncharacterized protein n=1 Tax=Streptomyces ipomoeae TaxID=103232 RepID=A0AAE8W5W4_9ACTN|nr:hypothetical protein Sipo8835_05325 [Streptomyces ipomoeae]
MQSPGVHDQGEASSAPRPLGPSAPRLSALGSRLSALGSRLSALRPPRTRSCWCRTSSAGVVPWNCSTAATPGPASSSTCTPWASPAAGRWRCGRGPPHNRPWWWTRPSSDGSRRARHGRSGLCSA